MLKKRMLAWEMLMVNGFIVHVCAVYHVSTFLFN